MTSRLLQLGGGPALVLRLLLARATRGLGNAVCGKPSDFCTRSTKSVSLRHQRQQTPVLIETWKALQASQRVYSSVLAALASLLS